MPGPVGTQSGSAGTGREGGGGLRAVIGTERILKELSWSLK